MSLFITNDVFGGDKALHFGISSVGTVAIAYTLAVKRYPKWSILIASPIMMLTAGVAKEIILDNHVDTGDMIANTLGVTAGVGFLILF